MDRYLILAVEYEPDATDAQRSLGWVAPELVDAGLTMTADMLGVRRWAGVIDSDRYERFVDSWGGDAHLANYRHTWDGMEWEAGGSSPIVWASLTATTLEPVKPNLPFVYVG
jgi:hypothetical protein